MIIEGLSFPGWEPKVETRSAILHEEKARVLAATLDRSQDNYRPGDALPPLWQWIYFTPEPLAGETGPDGHPLRGSFMPPVDLPRRMFAGATMRFIAPLLLGIATERVAEVLSVRAKSGRTGNLVFAQVRHRYSQQGKLCLEEIQDIVYREGGGRTAAPIQVLPPPVMPGEWRREIKPDPVLLFRISAVTFNSHRIHYDRPYAMEVEGYPGLVVHGPLTAILLADLVRRNDRRDLAAFSFKAMAPLFDGHPFHVSGHPQDGAVDLVAVRPDQAKAMEARAEFR